MGVRRSNEEIKLRKAFALLTAQVKHALALIDVEMANPSDAGRGRRIAKITNGLEMANDLARLSLGIDLKTGKVRKSLPHPSPDRG